MNWKWLDIHFWIGKCHLDDGSCRPAFAAYSHWSIIYARGISETVTCGRRVQRIDSCRVTLSHKRSPTPVGWEECYNRTIVCMQIAVFQHEHVFQFTICFEINLSIQSVNFFLKKLNINWSITRLSTIPTLNKESKQILFWLKFSLIWI